MNDFDYRLALMCGTDIPVPQCQLILHQPTLQEISLVGEEEYFIGAQCLTLNKSMFTFEGKNVLDDITNFQIFMMVMTDQQAKDKKEATIQVLQLLCPSYKAMFSPRSLILMSAANGNITIDENNFDYFQNALRLIFCSRNGPMDQQSFNPSGDKAREIAQKLMKGRERIAQEKKSSGSTLTQYLSILVIALSIGLHELKSYTLFQIYDLIERYQLYTSYDIDIRSRLAGGKPDSHPDDWMKNLH